MTSVLLCMPCFDGLVHASTMQTAISVVVALSKLGIETELFTISQESLIPRARNVFAARLLKSTHSHALFLDADISVHPCVVARMIQANFPIVCCPYPKKSSEISFTSAPVNETSIDNWICEVDHAATGCMLVHRCVFETLKNTATSYLNDIPGYEDHCDNGAFWDFFQVGVKDGRYLSEDYGFCNMAKAHGFKIHALIGCNITHTGRYGFSGRFLGST